MPTRPYTVFDGYNMTLYNADGTVVGSWAAISGVRGHQKPSEQFYTNVGPLPEGHYSFSVGDIQLLDSTQQLAGLVGRGRWPGSMAAWGTERAFLTPDFDTHGRSGFSIHGGFWPGSEGCIDMGPNEKAYFDACQALGASTIDVIVQYNPELETGPNPLAAHTWFSNVTDYMFREIPGVLQRWFPSGTLVDPDKTTGSISVDTIANDSSRAAAGYDSNAKEGWDFAQPAGGSGVFTGLDGTVTDFKVDEPAKFEEIHGAPVVDGGATSTASSDAIDFSSDSGNVYLSSTRSGTGVELYHDRNFSQDERVSFTNFNTLILGNGNNKVQLYTADDPFLTTVQTGNGDNIIASDVVNLKINLGTGKNIIGHLGAGTTVNAQGGHNKFLTSDDILLTGLTPTDEVLADGMALRGAVGFIGSEDPWIVGPNGTRYGLNFQGYLAIKDLSGGITYVANYQGGPDVAYDQQTAGIFLGEAETFALRILDLLRPHVGTMMTLFKLGNELLYARTGKTFFNSDPLVFDLGGTGVNLTALSAAAPMLDMRGTGFAVHSGWVQPNDGILVLQQAGHSGTPNISEMFGGPGAEGFAALASYDSNADGVIDSNDTVFSQLRMWVDRNQNGAVDTGELETLTQADVASINLASTTQTGDTQAGNRITATGSFRRTDGSTGAIADVNFNVDTTHSKYLGDSTISAAAAAKPNLKGYGTLTDLRVAMTLDPTLIDTINTNLPNLNDPDLGALRAAALPIFLAWARAVKLPDAGGTLQVIDPVTGHSDVSVLIKTGANGNVTVDDFGYRVTDGSGSYLKLASGALVRDADGNVIDRPTFAQVMAQTPASGSGDSWTNFTAGEIGFMERYIGQPFPIDQAPDNPSAMLEAMSSFINASLSALNLEAVRLAMQGPLAPYFQGIAYDTTTDSFTATTPGQLTPMYEAIFQAAPSDAAGATAWLTRWRPTIDVVLGDFARGQGLPVSYGYQFASMVRAFEASSLPLDIVAAASALGVPADEIIAGSGTLTGPDLSSIFYLHGGDQTAIGGKGLNNFVMGGSFGHDTIVDDEPAPSDNAPSILRFTNVKSTDVTATRAGLDLILAVNGTSEQVTVTGEFTGVRLGFNGAACTCFPLVEVRCSG